MVCRVCGQPYMGCRSTNVEPGVFRWKEVACSIECGDEYLRRIIESRGIAPKKVKKSRAVKLDENELDA